ncbi:uncharacterized protein LOC134579563 [Pelobates fuscus]|uniref:uncharacterized protein LOC134579563 n=1 Tax=Pelobates fuscus TaxID=191477 RepID=UPI002FE4BA8E
MSLESTPTPKNGDMIEISQPGHQHWAIYVGDGYIVHIAGRIVGSGEDSVHGGSVVVQKTELEAEAYDCTYRVNNKFDGEVVSLASDKVVESALKEVGEKKPYGFSCLTFALELKYGSANLDMIIRALAPIPGEMALTAAKGVKIVGSVLNTGSEVMGSVTAKGVDLAGQGVTAVSGVLGSAAGKGLAMVGNMLASGAQTLAPIVASKAETLPAGPAAMLLSAAEYIAPLAESLAKQPGEAEETMTRGIRDLGSAISESSGAVGSAFATGLSWLGSASSAGASSIIGYLKSDTEPTISETAEEMSTIEAPDKS